MNIRIFKICGTLLMVVVFAIACGNSPSIPSQNNYELEVNGNYINSILYYVGKGTVVGLGQGYSQPITTTDWNYSFQGSSGENYSIFACTGMYVPMTINIWKNGVIVDATTTSICASFSGTLP